MLEQFLETLEQKGYKPATIEQYRSGINLFINWLGKKGLSLWDTSTEQISNYYYEVVESGRSSSTIYKKTQAVFAFYEWLEHEGYLLINPAPSPVPVTGDRLPRSVAHSDDIRKAFTKLYNSKRLVEMKNAAMLDLFYSCGIRREELQRLNLKDIDFYTGTVRIFGKGDRERVVPIGEKSMRHLRDYVLTVRPKLAKAGRTPALFVSWQQGGKRMCKGAISRAFVRFRKRYNLSKKLTPHAVRHAFAVDLLRGGASVVDVSKMLGHEKLETTQIYTRLAPADLKKQHRKYHPRG